MFTDTEAYLYGENVALGKKYENDVVHLSNEIYRLIDLIKSRDETIENLEQRNIEIATKALAAAERLETQEIENSVLQSTVYILLKSIRRDCPNSVLFDLDELRIDDSVIKLPRLGRILFDYMTEKDPKMDKNQRIYIISKVLDISI